MPTSARENVLYELARTMVAKEDQAAAVALRKLAQAGYASLDEVDSASDWTLLSIPGLGVGRLDAIRRLTRHDWHSPSRQAVKVVSRFVSAVRLALRFWPPETLASLLQGSAPVSVPGQPYERRLALKCFSRMAHQALNHCPPDELVKIVQTTGTGRQRQQAEPFITCTDQAPSEEEPHQEVATGTSLEAMSDRSKARETDHFAYPEQERRDIVRHYRAARERGEVNSKEWWARANYSISARTLLSYEHEFREE